MSKYALILLLAGLYLAGYGQTTYPLHLKGETLTPTELTRISQQFAQQADWLPYTCQGQVYAILLTDAPPASPVFSELKALGMQMLGFLPERAYFVSMPLSLLPLETSGLALLPLQASWKLSPSVKLAAASRSDQEVLLVPMPGLNPDVLQREVRQAFGLEGQIVEGALQLRLPYERIPEVAAHPAVMFVEPPEPEPQPEGLIGNAMLQLAPWQEAGQYDGSGQILSIADDGFPRHPDLKGRVLEFPGQDFGAAHAALTMGVSSAAGNISPRGQGVAPAVEVHLSSIIGYAHINQAISRFQEYGSRITSTSYGDGCGGVYTYSASLIDQQLETTPYLLHCFSAGNDRYNNCSATYGHIFGGNGQYYGNITGGRKTSKVSVTVGNSNTQGALVGSSSVGPTEDGRLKPDIVAVGTGNLTLQPPFGYRQGSGTSAAAPAVAGILAVMSQAYEEVYGELPYSDILKSALLVSARDCGRPGPDFESGWGMADAQAAVEIIEEEQFFRGSLQHGQLKTFAVYVPEEAGQSKIMLYWHDKAGLPVAGKALVNDLDLEVIGPDGQLHQPLVLKTEGQASAILAEAEPGTDRLNNAEQVVLHAPKPGWYSVQVRGHWVPQGPQSFVIAWSHQAEGLAIRYPNADVRLEPGQPSVVQWEALGTEGPFQLHYRKEGTANWVLVASQIPAHLRSWLWTVPDELNGSVVFRLSAAGGQAYSTACSVMPSPGFRIASQPGSARLLWEAVPGAQEYQVYRLGDQFMEKIGSTSALQYPLPLSGAGNWYSVQAVGVGGLASPRAFAQYYDPEGCQSALQLELQLDAKPGEVSWSITSEEGQRLYTGGPYPPALAHQALNIPLCLPAGCFTFDIKDAGHDGLCCTFGAGQYQLRDGEGQLLASDGNFGGMASSSFCLESGQHSPLQLSLEGSSSVSCYNAADGWAAASVSGGTGNYSFNWSNGGTQDQITQLPAGQYSLTVSDGTQAVSSSITIAAPEPVSSSLQVSPAVCGGAALGQVSVEASGGTPPYQYAWSNSLSGAAGLALPPGQYTLTVTDASSCQHTRAFTIPEAEGMEVMLLALPSTCAGSKDGQLIAEISGGQPPYEYEWSTGSGAPALSNLPAGTYSLTVTDDNGCVSTATAYVSATSPLSAQITFLPFQNLLLAAGSGGSPPYSFQWSNGTQADTLHPQPGESYALTLTDAAGCLVSSSWVPPSMGGSAVYCTPEVQYNTYNWIESLRLDTLYYQSGQGSEGYTDHTDSTGGVFPLEAGQSYSLVLLPGFANSPFTLHWRGWADWDADGDFSEEEELFAKNVEQGDSLQLMISVPDSLFPGYRRLRISQSFGYTPQACGDILYGESEDFLIKIGSSAAPEYCESHGQSTSLEWIEGIRWDGTAFPSGNNGGYADRTMIPLSATAGDTSSIVLIPGYASNMLPEYWTVWVDFDRDGQFEGAETVLQQGPAVGEVAANIIWPEQVVPGPVRMRVQMRWSNGGEPCGSFTWGEVEDYTVNLAAPALSLKRRPGLVSTAEFTAWPNPVSTGQLQAAWKAGAPDAQAQLLLVDAFGRVVREEQVPQIEGINQVKLMITGLPAGIYYLQLRSVEGQKTCRLVVK